MNDMLQKIGKIGLVPVIKINNPSHAVPLGKALISGGIPVAEVTFRTDAAEEAIRRMREELPDLIVGAGTVISPELAKKAVAAGASFIVSPGFNQKTVEWCLENDVPVLPGINNPSLIEQGLSLGLDVFKFFPAENYGGASMLKALSAPFGSVKFVPTGGINANNLADYARLDSVLAIGGSWMVKSDLIDNEQWEQIAALCREARLKLQGFSFVHMGINQENADQARETASILSVMGFPVNEGSASIFAGSVFEVMKSPLRGANGHIAIGCFNVERALEYLAQYGFKGVQETARTENGRLKLIYLDKEVGGFALHLIRV
ncbi:bifunctional 4-hydroxy-2-oxoglutarate aldolase/2-dehydro-3-deoxy-phosphogluconate aldolase [Spirochaetia bacterium 38H-sp]|uniref:2-dehydro-3-deoxy-phosphogluconate aldolase n=1 Tax=Rarispira pelagica TaxID=3141764 RepID=A0ABU9UDS2_9SPIR